LKDQSKKASTLFNSEEKKRKRGKHCWRGSPRRREKASRLVGRKKKQWYWAKGKEGTVWMRASLSLFPYGRRGEKKPKSHTDPVKGKKKGTGRSFLITGREKEKERASFNSFNRSEKEKRKKRGTNWRKRDSQLRKRISMSRFRRRDP